jgi:hypothetical protein
VKLAGSRDERGGCVVPRGMGEAAEWRRPRCADCSLEGPETCVAFSMGRRERISTLRIVVVRRGSSRTGRLRLLVEVADSTGSESCASDRRNGGMETSLRSPRESGTWLECPCKAGRGPHARMPGKASGPTAMASSASRSSRTSTASGRRCGGSGASSGRDERGTPVSGSRRQGPGVLIRPDS